MEPSHNVPASWRILWWITSWLSMILLCSKKEVLKLIEAKWKETESVMDFISRCEVLLLFVHKKSRTPSASTISAWPIYFPHGQIVKLMIFRWRTTTYTSISISVKDMVKRCQYRKCNGGNHRAQRMRRLHLRNLLDGWVNHCRKHVKLKLQSPSLYQARPKKKREYKRPTLQERQRHYSFPKMAVREIFRGRDETWSRNFLRAKMPWGSRKKQWFEILLYHQLISHLIEGCLGVKGKI